MSKSFRFNFDAYRRDFIMGTEKAHYFAGIKDFTNATVEQMGRLLEENFMDPESQRNHCPPAREIYEFMKKWPQVTFDGYLVSPMRSDYRVSIVAVECDLKKIPEASKKAFHEDFKPFHRTAAEYRFSMELQLARARW